ncbi:MAG: hypothetical protein ACLGIF_09850 [Actinomycetes bacterium]
MGIFDKAKDPASDAGSASADEASGATKDTYEEHLDRSDDPATERLGDALSLAPTTPEE